MYKTHITASSAAVLKEPEQFLAIVRAVKKTGGKILENWIPRLVKRRKEVEIKESVLFRRVKEAIIRSDFLIAECSYFSTSVGINIEKAISLKIPVLCLYLREKEKNLSGGLVKGINSPLLVIKEYSPATILEVLKKFIKEIRKKRIKYTIFLTRRQAEYIEWLAQKRKRQSDSATSFKSEVVRKLIDEAMLKDKTYKAKNFL